MNGVIGEIISFIEEDVELSEEKKETYYSASAGGFGAEAMDAMKEAAVDCALITKISSDMQGQSHMGLIWDEGWGDEEDIHTSKAPSAIEMEGTLYIRSTAPATLKKSEILSSFKKHHIDRVLVSPLLLSFSPVKDEIVRAIKEGGIKRVVIDASDPTSILMVEDLKESIEAIAGPERECYLAGDIFTIEGVKRVSRENIIELFK